VGLPLSILNLSREVSIMDASSIGKSSGKSGAANGKAKELWPIVKETASDWSQDNAMRLSAALSLYTILSLAPLLVITIKIVGLVMQNKDSAREHLMSQLTNLMGGQAAEAVKPMLDSGAHGSGILATVISTAVLMFSATGVFIELQDSMNTIWGVKPKPNQGIWGFIRNRLLSLGMVFGIGFLLLVSMFVSTMLTTLAQSIVGNHKWLVFIVDIAVSFGAVAVLFGAIFKFLPDVKLQWKNVWVGALFTAGMFTIGKYALALYFKYATPTSAFGAAGSLAAVLLWVYYSSFILFFGAEFTKVWTKRRNSQQIVPEPEAVKITEEDRAEHGIPSEKRMAAALDGKPLHDAPQPTTPAVISPGSPGYAMAAGGLVMGVIAGGMTTRYLIGKQLKATVKKKYGRTARVVRITRR
jgi:membrane protein